MFTVQTNTAWPSAVVPPGYGLRILRSGTDRLFEPMRKLVTITDAVGLAYMAIVFGSIKIDPKTEYATAKCRQLPITVRFPALTPTQAIVNGEPLKDLELKFVPYEPPPSAGKRSTKVKGLGVFTIRAISPVFVDFYEKHTGWIKANLGGDTKSWPALFNFARMLRNFLSHHDGHVHFENPNAAPVTWHNLSYSPADEGHQVLNDDIDIGDLIVLMFELSDELNQLGCPLNP